MKYLRNENRGAREWFKYRHTAKNDLGGKWNDELVYRAWNPLFQARGGPVLQGLARGVKKTGDLVLPNPLHPPHPTLPLSDLVRTEGKAGEMGGGGGGKGGRCVGHPDRWVGRAGENVKIDITIAHPPIYAEPRGFRSREARREA